MYKTIVPLFSVQDNSHLYVNKKCTIFAKISKLKRPVNFLVRNTNLKYAVLGLKSVTFLIQV